MENEILLDYIGKTRTENLMIEIQNEFYERKFKAFPKGQENRLDPLSIVSVVDNGEIKAIGESCINDLILNNLAIWIKCTLLDSNISLENQCRDTNGTFHAMFWQGGSNQAWNNRNNVSLGSSVQVGSGVAGALISDFQIQTPFANGGFEDGLFGTGTSSYNAGLNRCFIPSAGSPTTGGGTIRESLFVMRWKGGGDVQRNFAIARDNISPSVNFSTGNAILIDYTFQL